MDLAVRFVAFASALAPIGLLALFFYARAGGRVSADLLGLALMVGGMSLFLVLGFGLLLKVAGLNVTTIDNIYLRGIVRAFLTAALPEELAKLCVLLFVVMRHEFCDGPEDILIGSIAVALGFAACENVFYLFDAVDEGKLAVTGPIRAVLPVPMHAIDGVFMGLFVSGIVNVGGRARQIAAGFGIAVLLHGLYDAPAMIIGYLPKPRTWPEMIAPGSLALFFLLFTIIVGAIGLRRLRLAAQDMPSLKFENVGAWRDKLLLPRLWRVIGAALLLLGLGFLAYAAWSLTNHNARGAVFVLHGFVPILFGIAMLRLAPRGSGLAVLAQHMSREIERAAD